MGSSRPKPTAPKGPWLLRRLDQAAVGALLLIGLGATVAWWCCQGGLRGRLVEVEQTGWQTCVRLYDDQDSPPEDCCA
jgi:hypothetical protein